MTVGFFLNMEVLLAKSVEDNLSRMTNANARYDEECGFEIPDYEAFECNLRNGFSAVLGMCAYVECSLNSLIRLAAEIYPYPGPGKDRYAVSVDEIKEALKLKMREKARWIISHGLANEDFRQGRLWQEYLKVADLRNDLIHYKSNWMQDALIIDFGRWKASGALEYEDLPSFDENIEGLGTVFTQEYLRAKWSDLQNLVIGAAKAMGCQIREGTMLIDSDARDGFADYFVKTAAFFDTYPDGIRL